MDKSYKSSRIIMGIGAVIILQEWILYRSEQWPVIPWLLGLLVYGISFTSSSISKKIIKIGENLNINIEKFCFMHCYQ